MRIAEVSAFYQYSVGKIMRDIKKYIDNNTNDVCEIFYARGKEVNIKGVTKIASNLSIYINALIARLLDNDGFCFKGVTKKLINELKKFNPDVVHIHCLHGYYLNVELLFKYFKDNPKIKVVWTMHDAWAVTGHCCYFNKANCNKWEKQCEKCPLKSEYPKSNFIDNSKRNYIKKKEIFTSLNSEQMIIVTPSNWIKDIFKKSYMNKYEIINIYNGIDLNVFNTIGKPLNKNNQKKKLLCVASVWDSRKGLDTIIELATKIDDSWEIIIIGKILNKIKMPKNIIHINRTNNQETLKHYYQECDVFFNPTTDDNYPTVNLEAQACGAKVLTFDTGGCKETNCGNLYLCSKDEFVNIKIEELYKNKLNFIDNDRLSIIRMIKDYCNIFRRIF